MHEPGGMPQIFLQEEEPQRMRIGALPPTTWEAILKAAAEHLPAPEKLREPHVYALLGVSRENVPIGVGFAGHPPGRLQAVSLPSTLPQRLGLKELSPEDFVQPQPVFIETSEQGTVRYRNKRSEALRFTGEPPAQVTDPNQEDSILLS